MSLIKQQFSHLTLQSTKKYHAENNVSGLILLKSKNVQSNGLISSLQQATKHHFQHQTKTTDNVKGQNFMLHVR
jgi:hypothetical protein